MLTAEELKKHPEFTRLNWDLKPTKEGLFPVARDRGGPINIAWQLHGHGPTHVVWVMGLGSFKTAWQRQTKDFAHDQPDKYSSLIIDNRGMGDSDKPLVRYSTTEMAKDILEVVDHVGWTSKHELHLVGISMGGMISQELSLLIPERIASLTLLSTAARIVNTVGFFENLRNRINLFIPKNVDVQLRQATDRLFGPDWIDKPDELGDFPTNRDRIAAGELNKRLDVDRFTRKGFLLQLIAAGWHHKSATQLKELGDQVGRERIQVLHGTADQMITVPHGHVLIKELEGPGLTSKIFEGTGHVIPIEHRAEFRKLMEAFFERTSGL